MRLVERNSRLLELGAAPTVGGAVAVRGACAGGQGAVTLRCAYQRMDVRGGCRSSIAFKLRIPAHGRGARRLQEQHRVQKFVRVLQVIAWELTTT